VKKLIIGVALGAVLVYLSMRGIDLQQVFDGFKQIRLDYTLLFLLIAFLVSVLRSVRWGLMLGPLERVSQLSVFSVSCVGFLAIVALPARLGELARPYLITQKSDIRMTAALGTIVAERVCDSLAVLAIFSVMLFFVPFLPPWLLRSAVFVSVPTIGFLILMIALIVKRDAALKALAPLIRLLPAGIALKIEGMLHHLIDGFGIFKDARLLLGVLLLSVLVWMVNAVAIFAMFQAFSWPLTFTAAAVVMIVLLIGIAMPAAPGFIGNWHYACILGLMLFGIPKADALTFAIVYHFLSMAVVIFPGIIFLPFNRFSIADMKKQAQAI
jgi:hypothetical protein